MEGGRGGWWWWWWWWRRRRISSTIHILLPLWNSDTKANAPTKPSYANWLPASCSKLYLPPSNVFYG
uniref:Secreted protein n=1 Tax=Syphacia muris TaxID=451379 RepID=A0A0N5B1G8_9BILA